jgi:polysaccharide biosynthesis protein PslG
MIQSMAGRLRRLAGCLAGAITPLALALGLTGLIAAGMADRAAASAGAAAVAPLGGVNVAGLYDGASPAAADRELATARTLHAGVVRASIPWSVLEPVGPGQISPRALAFTDRLMIDAKAAGIRVIMIVDSTPCWATTAPASLLRGCAGAGESSANAWPPRNPSAYAAFVAYLARRYGTQLAAIEIWNEPDQANQLYFAGPDKAQRYADIVRAAYPAIKSANPQVPVIAGSLVGSNGAFLRALYAAGIKGYYDGLAVHFYNLVLASVRSIREVQLANGDAKPLWLDEFGWSSCYPRHRIQEEQACVSTSVQASNIANAFRSLARTPFVAAVVVYDLQNSGHEEFGVLTGPGARKPAFAALSRVLTSPFSSASPVTLSLRRRGGRVLASGSAPVGDYMELEGFLAGVLRYRALFTLDRFNRYSIALPKVLGTRGLHVRVFQFWAGSAKAAQRGI